jgi:hypothetical protein
MLWWAATVAASGGVLLAPCYQEARTLLRMFPMPPRRPCRRGRAGAAVLALAVLGCLLPACGGRSPNSVASLGPKTTTTFDAGATATTLPPGQTTEENFERAVKFSRCMRTHGVTNFPDPGPTGGIQLNSNSGIDPTSPQFQAAQSACQKYAPPKPTHAQQEQAEQQALAFAACMRAHGLPSFPDPTFGPNGGIMSRGYGSNGVDPNSPAFQAAVKHCNP